MDDPQSKKSVSPQVENATGIAYRKLRSPSQHGQRLDLPPLTSVAELWRDNLALQSANRNLQVGKLSLFDFQRQARSEVIKLAAKYTNTYIDLTVDASGKNIVMAGHQPELFHPGVWFKNFVLSNLGQQFDSIAINLVVDNDICGNTSIRYPNTATNAMGQQSVILGSIPLDTPGPNETFEARVVQNWNRFENFGERVTDAIAHRVNNPIIRRLWPNVIEAAQRILGDQHPRIGHAIAAGRHRLEHEIGLRTLEVPISWISTSQSFAMFANSILADNARFRDCYNKTLFDYRHVHKIRSTSHPVPELEKRDDWIEAPFWVWKKSNPVRRRLFSRRAAGHIELSDLAGWEVKIATSEFSKQFTALNVQGIAIRPKALMTTMFSRLLICDLFLHGIGGAKYDQLTDVIARRFFSVRLPEYLTLSATMTLPTNSDLTGRSDVVDLEQRLRILKFHPETMISNPSEEARELIKRKRDWTTGEGMSERSRKKHLAIESLNLRLAGFANMTEKELIAGREEAQSKIRESQILGSREFSFCLFPDSLISELQRLAIDP